MRPGVSTPATAAKRTSSDCGARRPQPTHVLTGPRRSRVVARLLGEVGSLDRHLDVRGDRDLRDVGHGGLDGIRLLDGQLARGERLLDLGDRFLGGGHVLGHRLGGGELDVGIDCDAGGRIARELLVRRDAAVARAGKRSVRAALPVREDRGAAAGEVSVAVVLAGEGGLRLRLRELGART